MCEVCAISKLWWCVCIFFCDPYLPNARDLRCLRKRTKNSMVRLTLIEYLRCTVNSQLSAKYV